MATLMGAADRGHTNECGRPSPWFALLALALAPLACGQAPSVCPPMGSLPSDAAEVLAPPDPSAPIEISSDAASLGLSGDATLSGKVEVRQGNRQLRAENVQYDAAQRDFRIDGKVEYHDPLVSVRGGGGRYSALEGARFHDAEFELPSRPARGTAAEMALGPDGRIALERVTYSTCPATDRAWELRATAITLDTHTRSGTGRGTRVEFKDVPILYLPWISFPLGSERKSGFLFPNAGHSSRSGAQFTAPWYWNIAPHYDATLEPVYYGARGVELGGEFRYLGTRRRGDVRVQYLPDDRSYGDDRGRFQLNHTEELPRGWRALLLAGHVSDAEYFEDFGQGPESTSVAFVERLAAISHRDEHWLLRGEIQHFQTIDRTLAAIDRPYARLPRLTARGQWSLGERRLLQYGFEGEVVNFERDLGVTGWRLDLAPGVGLNLEGPGYFLRPRADLRWMGYALEDQAPGSRSSPSRAVPQASLDAGLVFERAMGSNATELWTLEPRLLFLYTPFREQSDLPLFDTALPDLDLVQLFRTNRYVGGDRVSDANQLSLGVTTRLIDAADGSQFLAATLGQAIYFETPRVHLPGEAVRDRDSSDLIAQLSLAAYRNWSIDLGLQWNTEQSDTERAKLELQYRPDSERVVNLGYRQQRGRLEQMELSAAWPLSRRWNAFARTVYSLHDSQAIENFAGLEYRACCWRLRTVARRFVSSRTGEHDTGIYLQLELTGLASVGVPADAFLERTIRGYSPAR